MAKIYLLVVFFLLCSNSQLFCQRKVIDQMTPMSWPLMNSKKISNDGKYIIYKVGTQVTQDTLVVEAANRNWKRKIIGHCEEINFSEDSRTIVFLKSPNCLCILNLVNNELQYIDSVISYKMPNKGDGQWLAFCKKGPVNDLVLLNLLTKEKQEISNVGEYSFSGNGRVLLIQGIALLRGGKQNMLTWFDLNNGKQSIIGSGYEATHFIFDRTFTRIAFLTKENNFGRCGVKLRYYCCGMDSAEVRSDDLTPGMEGMSISEEGDIYFDKSGSKIFFCIEDKLGLDEFNDSGKKPKVEIWNYRDEDIQFKKQKGPFLAVVGLQTNHKVIRLQQAGDLTCFFVKEGIQDYIAVRSNSIGNYSEYHWRKSARPDIFLVSTSDGTRILVKKRLIGNFVGFSLKGKYLIWYDKSDKNWFTYNIVNKTEKNITDGIHQPLYYEEDHPDLPAPYSLAGWIENDAAVLVYDRHDIWEVDPLGIKSPINCTKGYGRKHNIQLRWLNFDKIQEIPIHKHDTLFLSAFNFNTKCNGFFKITLGNNSHLSQLIMGPNTYYFPYPYSSPDFPSLNDPVFPLKAKNADVYMVTRMSAVEYPNLYVTSDFKHFTQITELEPQKEYNWLTTQLIQWKLFDGRLAVGLLYKPQNFDPKNKYPIIYYYYERMSDALHLFIHPALSNGVMNIPWFVSNGYLVFVPDIYFKDGHPGESAYNSIVSSAMYLSKKPWVNAHKMGLQGHSFGGWETNYIVTRTALFAAAAPAAGSSNLISAYGQFEGSRMQWFYENRQGRMGATLWQRPDLFIRNSPIFRADKVTTPLLIMHNKADGVVLFNQEAEWYSALTRLNKKVWLLSYDQEHHTIEDEENQLDYSIRLGQFFDHYLKDKPAPKWMTMGGLSMERGVSFSLELDSVSQKP